LKIHLGPQAYPKKKKTFAKTGAGAQKEGGPRRIVGRVHGSREKKRKARSALWADERKKINKPTFKWWAGEEGVEKNKMTKDGLRKRNSIPADGLPSGHAMEKEKAGGQSDGRKGKGTKGWVLGDGAGSKDWRGELSVLLQIPMGQTTIQQEWGQETSEKEPERPVREGGT